MTDLALLARELEVSDRTLRRAAARGAIRCVPRGQRLDLPVQEALYLRRRWPLLNMLVAALRTIPNVRLAVLFGSTARGDDGVRSDLDLLVRFGMPGLRARALLLDRLENASGRPVQVVEVAEAGPLLLAGALREGRVLVDRDGDWEKLVSRRGDVMARAEAARAELEVEVWDALSDVSAGAAVR